jgi:hypothetical protein
MYKGVPSEAKVMLHILDSLKCTAHPFLSQSHHNLDFTCSNFRFLGPLKEYLGGRRIARGAEV